MGAGQKIAICRAPWAISAESRRSALLLRAARAAGLECLTLFAFSSENWKRPNDEISDLMGLLRRFIKSDLPDFVENGIRLKIIGDYKVLDPDIVSMLEDALAQTKGGSVTLAVALNYGSQQEIARAAQVGFPGGRNHALRASQRTSIRLICRHSTC